MSFVTINISKSYKTIYVFIYKNILGQIHNIICLKSVLYNERKFLNLKIKKSMDIKKNVLMKKPYCSLRKK